MRRSDRCEFCLSPQPPFSTRRDKRLGRVVVVCARHRDKSEKLTPRLRETVARRLMRLAAGGGA